MTTTEALQQLGLSQHEAEVYLCLLQNGPLSPTDIAHKTGIKRPNVYAIAQTLEQKGLLYYQLVNKRKLLTAADPENIQDLVKQKLDLATSLLPHLKSIDTTGGFKANITFYQGRKAMQEMMNHALTMKKKEFCGLWPATDMNKILGKKFVEDFIAIRIKKNINLRTLQDASKESFYDEEVKTEKGRNLTHFAYVPDKYTFSLGMGIYDDTVAFYSSKKESYGFLVKSKEFAEVIRMFYDNLWDHSGKLKKD